MAAGGGWRGVQIGRGWIKLSGVIVNCRRSSGAE